MENKIKVELAEFKKEKGVSEYQLMLHAKNAEESFEDQLISIVKAYKTTLKDFPTSVSTIFMRFFLSDAVNQIDILTEYLPEIQDCAVSVIEQPPLDGSKVALWMYLQSNVTVSLLASGLTAVTHNDYTHYWAGNLHSNAATSETQTLDIFSKYISMLNAEQCSFANQCIRTWLFVRDVDTNYGGMVKARNTIFEHNNLTPHTHYIASTGINGRTANVQALIQMDAYSVKGLSNQQIGYLYAPTHLNPTHEYGVSFERGTFVDYGDRRHVFISGTASINNKGEIVYKGDIRKQTMRMIENVGVLLNEAACNFSDIQQMIVYLRDIADYSVVKLLIEQHFEGIPKVIVHAPVCRPGWLIEMECIAIKSVQNGLYAPL